MAKPGRKPAHQERIRGKSNRQRMWEAMRSHAEGFTGYQIARRSKVNDATVRSYIQSLEKAGYLERIAGADHFEEQTLRLIKDMGIEAPAVTRQGKASTAGQGNEAMWRTLRILSTLSARQLAEHASATVTVSLWSARSYLKWLNRAGYVELLSDKSGDKNARYRMISSRYTGPRPPMIQRGGNLYDPNLGKVVFMLPCPK
jgi:response regulator of citrate/malate metabolism